jgi:hypothetical protein
VQVWYRRLPNQSECQLRKKLTLNGAAQQAGVCSLSTVRGHPAIGRSVTTRDIPERAELALRMR